MDKNIKISAVIPVYNCERFVEKCINSILEQTYENFEIVILNDGSKDGSLKLIQNKYGKNDKIRIIDKENSGVSDTRNIGIESSSGDWITFIDADDWIEKDTFEKVVDIISRIENIEMILTNIYYNYGNKAKTEFDVPRDLIADKKELIETIIELTYGQKRYGKKYGNCRCIGGKFYKLALLRENKIKFPTDLVSFEDGIFNLYASYYAKNVYISKNMLYHYFMNYNSRTNTLNEKQVDQNISILKNIEEFLDKFNIENNVVGYTCINLFSTLIKLIVVKNKKNKKSGYLEIRDTIAMFEKYFFKGKIEKKYLSMKDKIVYSLVKSKKYKTLYNLFYYKNIKNIRKSDEYLKSH